jgi:aminopeptidase S
VTTILSAPITLGPGKWTIQLRFTFAHDASATSADFLRLGVVRGTRSTAIWTARGKQLERNAVWKTKSFSLSSYAGQTIRIKLSAADGAADNLVEAAVDNVRIFQKP